MSVPDYALEETIDFKFTSRSFSTGIPTTLAGTPAVEIYEDNGLTQITAAETLTVDFDSVTGLNNLRVACTAANGFEAGKSYQAVISAGTVGGVSVVGEVVAQWSIQRSPVNWAKVTAPTTAVDLSATDIQLCDTTTAVTNQVTANATAISGSTAAADNVEIIYDTHYANNYDATNRRWYVDSVAISSSMTAANNAQAAFDGTGYAFTNCTIPSVVGSVGSVLGAVDSVNGAVGSVAGNVDGSVGSVLGGINTTAGTITTLDALDTAQDTQHTTTQGKVDTAQLDLDAITAADGVVVGPTAVASIFSTTALTEAYAADGAAGTAAEILYLIQQAVTEFAFLTTTKTVKQLDGTTPAATFTLDDADNPTSSTRAT